MHGNIAAALDSVPEETVLYGELVVIGEDGKPDFNLLQNFRSASSRVVFYAFNILVHKGRNLTALALSERRQILRKTVATNEHVALSEVANLSAAEMLKFVREHGLGGVVAKRSDSVYQPGLRTGLWSKYRINLGRELVIGG